MNKQGRFSKEGGKLKQLVVGFVLALQLCQPALSAAQVVADPRAGSNKPQVTEKNVSQESS